MPSKPLQSFGWSSPTGSQYGPQLVRNSPQELALLGTQGKNNSNGGFSAPPQQTLFQSSKVSPLISERQPTQKEQESLNLAAYATSLSNWLIASQPSKIGNTTQGQLITNENNNLAINSGIDKLLFQTRQAQSQAAFANALSYWEIGQEKARANYRPPPVGVGVTPDVSNLNFQNGKVGGRVDFAANPFHEFLSGAGNYAKSAAITFGSQVESLPFAYSKQFELIGSGFKKPLEQEGQFPLTPEASKFQSTYAKPTYVGSLLGGPSTGRDIYYNAGSAAAEIGSLAIGLRGFVPIRTSNIAIDVLKTEKVAPALEEGTLASTKQAPAIQKVSVYKGLTFGYEEGGKPLVGRGYKGDLIFGNPKPEQTIPPNITPTQRGIEIPTGTNLSNKIFNSPEALNYMQQKNYLSSEDVKVSGALQNLRGLSEKAPVKVYGGFGEKPMKDIEAGPETQFVQTSVKGLQSRGGLKIETGESFKAGPLHGSYADRPFYPKKYSELSGDIDVTVKQQSTRGQLSESLAGGLAKVTTSKNRVFSSKGPDVFVEDLLTGSKNKVINLPSSKEEEGGILISKGTKVYGKSITTDVYKIEGQKVTSPKYNFARRVAVTGTLQGERSQATIFGLGKGTEGGKYLGPPAFRLKDVGRIYKGGLHLSEIYAGMGKTKESAQALESIGILRSRFGTETLGKAGFDFNAYLTGLGKNETPVFGISSKTEPLSSSGLISKSTSNTLLSSKISGSSLGSISSKKASSNVNRQLITSKGASYGKSKTSSYKSSLIGKSFGPSYSSKNVSSSSLIGPSGISSKYAESGFIGKSGLSVGPSKGPSGISFTGSSNLIGPPSAGPSGLITSSSTGKPSSSLIPPPSGSSSSTFIPTSTSLISPPSKAGKLLDFGGPAKKKRKYKIKEGFTQIKGLRINNVFSSNLNIKAGLNY